MHTILYEYTLLVYYTSCLFDFNTAFSTEYKYSLSHCYLNPWHTLNITIHALPFAIIITLFVCLHFTLFLLLTARVICI